MNANFTPELAKLRDAVNDLLNAQVEARVLICKLQDFLAPSRSKTADSALERMDEAETEVRSALSLACPE